MAEDVYSEVEYLKRRVQELESKLSEVNERIDDLVNANELEEYEEEEDEEQQLQ